MFIIVVEKANEISLQCFQKGFLEQYISEADKLVTI